MPCLPGNERATERLKDDPSAHERRALGWRCFLPRRWWDTPFLYILLAPVGIGFGIDGLLRLMGTHIPGSYVHMEGIPWGMLGLAFGSLLWLAEGTLILLRHRAGLWVLWAALYFSSLPSIWLLPGGTPEVVAAIIVPSILALWAWTSRGWFEKDWRRQEAPRAD